jgi:thiol-disulfide isomerase/thioredoxin
MIPIILLYASLVNDVRGLIAQHNEAAAERAVRTYQAQSGATPELAAALSWMARDALAGKRFNQAESYAAESRKMALQLLGSRSLDSDAWLPTALGASIEVHAQALAAEGKRAEAIGFLLEQLQSFSDTSIGERIHKNVNLLSLEGKPAPPLASNEWLGPKPQPLAALRGHPVLLFFWAHWCPDCKAMVPILAGIERTYAPQGLVLMGPTRRYGYAAGGEPAAPEEEKQYIERVRRQYYSSLAAMPAPVSRAAFAAYGASTTPTIVLIDGQGVVRLYHPGALTEGELTAAILPLIKK